MYVLKEKERASIGQKPSSREANRLASYEAPRLSLTVADWGEREMQTRCIKSDAHRRDGHHAVNPFNQIKKKIFATSETAPLFVVVAVVCGDRLRLPGKSKCDTIHY